MSVDVVAKFPSKGTRLLLENEPPSVVMITDTRVSYTGGNISKWKAPKQFRLSQNLIICYTSSNLYATIESLYQIAKEPTCGRGVYTTINGIKEIGSIFKDLHNEYGGFSEVIGVIWEKDEEKPKLFELMPPDYNTVFREGIVGIGHNLVLKNFKKLYEQKPFGLIGTEGTVHNISSLLIASYFSEAIEAVNDYTIGLPIQQTLITKDNMYEMEYDILRKNMSKPEALTISDSDELLKLPKNKYRAKKYKGQKRKALQIIPGLSKKN